MPSNNHLEQTGFVTGVLKPVAQVKRQAREKIMTIYELYLCDVAGEHKPIVMFQSKTPFMPVSVGERFDDHGWNRIGVGVVASESNPKRYTVHSIKHTVFDKEGVIYIQYWLNLEPYDGASSPAWGN